jgi:hypothetical protein
LPAVVVVMTDELTRDQQDHNPLDYDCCICEPDTVGYEELVLLAEVHRIVSEAIKGAGGSVPPVGSPAWWSADPASRIAGLLVLCEARLVDDPHRIAAEQLRDVSLAISGAMDWRAFANRHVPHTELQRRRDQLGPLHHPYTGGPVAWDTSSSETAA